MATARVNGVHLNYQWRDEGDEPPLVLVHGIAANLAFWHLTVVPLLPSTLPVLTYDLRGHGRSEMTPNGYTSADMADDLCALLDHLHVGWVDLVGHSFGGTVALHFAVTYPERVHTVVLADARVPSLQPWATLRSAAVPLAEAVDIPFAPSQRQGDAATKWRQLLESTTASRDLRLVAGLTPGRIGAVRAPVMLMYGSRSHCRPTLEALCRHVHPQRVQIVPGAGHFHPVDQATVFASEIRAFAADFA